MSGAIIDEQDMWLLTNFDWSIGARGYLITAIKDGDGRWGVGYLHRMIVGARPGETIDHINRNKLDCRRANLRHVTRSQNVLNQGKKAGKQGVPQSKYRGVRWDSSRGKWVAGLMDKNLGRFGSEDDAARARDAAVIKAGMQNFTPLNFPEGHDHVRH